MYRQGHGDCFLLAFRRPNGQPFYVLIDCGMKKGSRPAGAPSIQEVADDIAQATRNRLHLAIVTHEHEDHVSGLLTAKSTFKGMKVDRLWLAWTEDPDDPLANRLRTQFHDELIGLVKAYQRMELLTKDANQGGFGLSTTANHLMGVVKDTLGFNLDEDERALPAAELKTKIAGLSNKTAIKVLRDQADEIEYLSPGDQRPLMRVRPVSRDCKAYVLGPPRDLALLRDMDPRGDEQFSLAAAMAEERSFFAALANDEPAEELKLNQTDDDDRGRPFAAPGIPAASTAEAWKRYASSNQSLPKDFDDADWRAIDHDWLMSSETFALRMGNMVNNTSLVLAFELPGTKKVLLFVGDAQRGNWISWCDLTWKGSDGKTVPTSDLLNRTVFYKVGHHGSHNATMNAGGLADMAASPFVKDFVAMIPAHEEWALNLKPKPWVHPDPHILKALLSKTRGRVIRLDEEVEEDRPDCVSITKSEWKAFYQNLTQNEFYREFTIRDDA